MEYVIHVIHVYISFLPCTQSGYYSNSNAKEMIPFYSLLELQEPRDASALSLGRLQTLRA